MKRFICVILYSILFYVGLYGQDIIGPWSVVTENEIPDSIFNQDQIDADILDQFAATGREVRYVFFVKVDLDSMSGVTGGSYGTSTFLDLQRDPDSIEMIDIKYNQLILNDSNGNSSFSFSGTPTYQNSTGLINVYDNGLTLNIINMPSGYWGRSFNGSNEYAYLFQFVSAEFPVVSNIDEYVNKSKSLSVYPNPGRELVNIDIEMNLNPNSIEIHNSFGQIVWFQSCSSFSLKHIINCNQWPSGIYWIIVKGELDKIIALERLLVK